MIFSKEKNEKANTTMINLLKKIVVQIGSAFRYFLCLFGKMFS